MYVIKNIFNFIFFQSATNLLFHLSHIEFFNETFYGSKLMLTFYKYMFIFFIKPRYRFDGNQWNTRDQESLK